MWLVGQVGDEEVARLLAGGLAGPAAGRSGGGCHPPRDRQGPRSARPGAAQAVVAEVAGPLAAPSTPGAWYSRLAGGRDRRNLPGPGCSPANDQTVGRPATHRVSRPRSRRCGWSVWPSAAPRRCWGRPWARLARGRCPGPRGAAGRGGGAGMVLLADRELVGAELWRQAHATGAERGWRTRSNAVLPVLESLADGPTAVRSPRPPTAATASPRRWSGWWRTPLARIPAALASRRPTGC